MKSDYNTRQKGLIIDCLKNSSEHITAAGIVDLLKSRGESIGIATVYRRLEKMVDEGLIRKFVTDRGACFQYVGEGCDGHFHLKCTDCGTLFHVDCKFLGNLAPHILEHHGFTVDNRRTVMYGVCKKCSEKNNI